MCLDVRGPGLYLSNRWVHVDIFNLLGIELHSTDLTWEIVEARPRQIMKQLRPNDPAIVPPNGVSIALVNSFRSELFDLLYSSVQRGEELQAGDATPDSRPDLAQALDKINRAKLNGHTRIWDAEICVPGNWLGVDSALNHSDIPAGSSLDPSPRSFVDKPRSGKEADRMSSRKISSVAGTMLHEAVYVVTFLSVRNAAEVHFECNHSC